MSTWSCDLGRSAQQNSKRWARVASRQAHVSHGDLDHGESISKAAPRLSRLHGEREEKQPSRSEPWLVGSSSASRHRRRRRSPSRTSSGCRPTSSRTCSPSSHPSTTSPCTRSCSARGDRRATPWRGVTCLCCLLGCRAGGVSRRWRRAVERSLAGRRRMSFAGQRTGDDSTARFVRAAVNLRDLDM